MDEAVLATILGGDEAVALLIVEPLHGSCGTHTSFAPGYGDDVQARYFRTNGASVEHAGIRAPHSAVNGDIFARVG
jgi:hypothetical protein